MNTYKQKCNFLLYLTTCPQRDTNRKSESNFLVFTKEKIQNTWPFGVQHSTHKICLKGYSNPPSFSRRFSCQKVMAHSNRFTLSVNLSIAMINLRGRLTFYFGYQVYSDCLATRQFFIEGFFLFNWRHVKIADKSKLLRHTKIGIHVKNKKLLESLCNVTPWKGAISRFQGFGGFKRKWLSNVLT